MTDTTAGTTITKPKLKIAVLGTAPSSITMAPFADPSWRIWACSPGVVPHLRRVDAFFELHRFEPPWGPTGPKIWFTTDYINFLAGLKCPVFMLEPVKEIPASQAYPFHDVMRYEYLPRATFKDRDGIEREVKSVFSPYVWASTLSWMIALAIIEGADEIALYGVDMSAAEEWFYQRSGCQELLRVAKQIGIKVAVPHESDLLRPPPPYGLCEIDPMYTKLLKRRDEMLAMKNKADADLKEATNRYCYAWGASDDIEYMIKTWPSDPLNIEMTYANPELPEVKAVEPPLMQPVIDSIVADNAVEQPTWGPIIEGVAKPKRPRRGRNGKHPEAGAV